jgi:hypothetical protein
MSNGFTPFSSLNRNGPTGMAGAYPPVASGFKEFRRVAYRRLPRRLAVPMPCQAAAAVSSVRAWA